jgi:hypothetical protein
VIRIPIRITNETFAALQILARQEYRDVRQQAAWIIEHELEVRRLVTVETQTDSEPAEVEALTRPLESQQAVKNATC